MSIKINKLEIENIKRVKAVKIEPTLNGLTIVGGNNNQGKTSILDAIAWGLGGNKYKPSEPQRQGSIVPPYLHIVLSNGLIVERKGKNSDLKVIDPNGDKSGQQILNSFVEELAIDLPKFMDMTNKEKANTLLSIVGVGEKLYALEQQEKEVYNKRHAIGQIADQKKKYAKEQPYFTDAPKELISATELIMQQQEILTRNGENQSKRRRHEEIKRLHMQQAQEIDRLKRELKAMQEAYDQTAADLDIAVKSITELVDESTAELENNIRNIDEINRKVRANLDKDRAEEDANEYRIEYDKLTSDLDSIRDEKTSLLQNANLPLEGLTVVDGELLYKGQRWDNMSGSDQLKVSTAIVRKLKPECGFILLDKLEQMDMDTLKEFGAWLEQEDLQAIATRVSTGDECSILIEDGYVVGDPIVPVGASDIPVQPQPQTQSWKAGEF